MLAALAAGMPMYMAQAHAHLGWVAYAELRRAEARDHLDRAWSAWHAVGPGVAMTGLILWPRLGLADTADEAIEWAKRCPGLPNETIEVRPVWEVA